MPVKHERELSSRRTFTIFLRLLQDFYWTSARSPIMILQYEYPHNQPEGGKHMGIHITWYDTSQTIVHYKIEGEWTWDDLYREGEKATAMCAAKPYRVDFIVDLLHSGPFPPRIIAQVRHLADRQLDNAGLTVIISQHRFAHTLYQVGVNIYGGIGDVFRMAYTPQEALRIIQQDRDERRAHPATH